MVVPQEHRHSYIRHLSTHSLSPPSPFTHNLLFTGINHRLTAVAKAMIGLICKEPLYRESLLSSSTIVDHNDVLIAAFTHTNSTENITDGSLERDVKRLGSSPTVLTTTFIPTRYEITAEMDAAYNLLLRNSVSSFKTAGTMIVNHQYLC